MHHWLLLINHNSLNLLLAAEYQKLSPQADNSCLSQEDFSCQNNHRSSHYHIYFETPKYCAEIETLAFFTKSEVEKDAQ
jgi:hypothetical protein